MWTGIEAARKKKSHAADILEAVEDIIKAATRQDAEEIIKKLNQKEKKRHETRNHDTTPQAPGPA